MGRVGSFSVAAPTGTSPTEVLFRGKHGDFQLKMWVTARGKPGGDRIESTAELYRELSTAKTVAPPHHGCRISVLCGLPPAGPPVVSRIR